MNKAIELALRTWYPKDHPLHLDPLHPAMGLVGEVGEWINKHKKDKYKPGFEFSREDELDELGDIWYYLRILAYIHNISKEPATPNSSMTNNELMAYLARYAGDILYDLMTYENVKPSIFWCIKLLKLVLSKIDTSLDELTALNWEKLKDGSERGEEWKKAWK